MLLRVAVTAVLCCNEVFSHDDLDEEIHIGDSQGCAEGFVNVDTVMECLAAKHIGDKTVGHHEYVGDYLTGNLAAAQAYTFYGCNYIPEGWILTGVSSAESRTFFNSAYGATLTPGYWGQSGGPRRMSTQVWPKPYCKKNGSMIHQNEVLFHGDENIDRWFHTSEDFPGSYNIGFPATCKSLQWRLENIFEAYEPAVVVTACGEKDIDEGASARKAYRRFVKFADFARKHHASLIYLGTKPFPQKRETERQTYKKYDEAIKRLVRRRGPENMVHNGKTLAMIDVHENFMSAGNPRDLYEFDGLRLSPKGYDFWSSWTHKALDDTTCLVWGPDVCKSRQKMSPVRRATATSPGGIIV